MLGYFPKPYPDELLYSLMARFSDHMGYPSHEAVIRDLFGRKVRPIIDLPQHLNSFVNLLPPNHSLTAESIITNHSLLPFYSPFLTSERVSLLQENMCEDKKTALHMQTGAATKPIKLKKLKLCIHCFEEDRNLFSEGYWHRAHQVPGVEICSTHKVILSTLNSLNPRKNFFEFISAESAFGEIIDQNELLGQYQSILLRIAQDAEWLLKHNIPGLSSHELHQRYLTILTERGLATYTGNIKVRDLTQTFENYYPANLLELLDCKLNQDITKENWLIRLVRTNRHVQHPLHHLLAIQALNSTAETFFDLSSKNLFWGDGPWSCLNPACEFYKKNQIFNYKLTYSERRIPVAIFECLCGYVYSKSVSASSNKKINHYRSSRVLNYGFVWEKKLEEKWEDKNLTLNQIAQQLEVAPLTIKRYASRLKLTFPRHFGKIPQLRQDLRLLAKDESLGQIETEKHRTEWLTFFKKNPRLGITGLRAQQPQLYRWLNKHDRNWVKANPPRKVHKKGIKPARIDWAFRDKQISEEVKEAALRLRNIPGRPVQVTKTRIGREIGQSGLLQNSLNRLPLTNEILSHLTESDEEFAIRRIKWAVALYKQELIYPPRWKLERRAGVTHSAKLPTIRTAIDKGVQILQLQFSILLFLSNG